MNNCDRSLPGHEANPQLMAQALLRVKVQKKPQRWITEAREQCALAARINSSLQKPVFDWLERLRLRLKGCDNSFQLFVKCRHGNMESCLTNTSRKPTANIPTTDLLQGYLRTERQNGWMDGRVDGTHSASFTALWISSILNRLAQVVSKLLLSCEE